MKRKLRGVQYILKQSVVNLARNWYMLLASVFVLFASLFIMGSLGLASVNVQHVLDEQAGRPEMEILCFPSVTEDAADLIHKTILEDPRIEACVRVSRAENLKKLTDWFAEIGMSEVEYPTEDSSYTRVSFDVRLKESTDLTQFEADMRKVSGIEDVESNQTVRKYFTDLRNGVRTGTYVSLVVLGLLSVLLMLNTIRLTVFARKKELHIMKYVGASYAYMRGPFVVEGVAIGLLGAILSFLAVRAAYMYLCTYLAHSASSIQDLITVIPFDDLGLKLFGLFILGGVVTGLSASMLAIKRYIKV
ncbi:MAG: permease-like cell division protein FtsX [Clostridia bacterium]|nr:permease-like cell division protein FtsX [Clostridia bacterium]